MPLQTHAQSLLRPSRRLLLTTTQRKALSTTPSRLSSAPNLGDTTKTPPGTTNNNNKTTASTSTGTSTSGTSTQDPHTSKPKRKTLAEMDEEMRLKMAGLAGDGGEAGVELEDGQPVAMKRGVRNNMFRYI